MKDMVKKYLPYTVVIFAVYIIVPLFFRNAALSNFVGIAWYFIFPATAAASAAIYCSKYGLDFLFSLIAPIFFLPSMFLYYGGINLPNILLLVVYLVAGMFGLFIGDIALGDKRRQREEKEKAEAEEMLLEAKRRDEREREKMTDFDGLTTGDRHSSKKTAPKRQPPAKQPSGTHRASVKETKSDNYDDFDYDKYLSDIDKRTAVNESEIDDILSEYGKH